MESFSAVDPSPNSLWICGQVRSAPMRMTNFVSAIFVGGICHPSLSTTSKLAHRRTPKGDSLSAEMVAESRRCDQVDGSTLTSSTASNRGLPRKRVVPDLPPECLDVAGRLQHRNRP